jgi:hypothetical protein
MRTIGEMTAEHGEHPTKSIVHSLMIESPNPEDIGNPLSNVP